MGPRVPELRARAERLKREIARERYETKAGLKERPNLSDRYASHELLLGEEAIPAIQRELAQATGEEQRRLRYLLAWVAEQRVEAAVAPLEDELRAWQSTVTVRLGRRELPIRRVARTLENEPNRGTRIALERARNERFEEARSLQIDLLYREREAIADLGFGSYVEARGRLSGLNVGALEHQAVEILAATREAHAAHLARQLERHLGVTREQAARSDAAWLRRMPWLNGRFGLSRTLERVREDLAAAGLPLEAGGKLRLDLEERPLRWSGSFCVPLSVPDEVVLGVSSTGGWPDTRALLHEVGHGLHFAHTERSLPWEFRALGDTAVTEAYALLFELLSQERCWVQRAARLGGEELEEYLLLTGLLRVVELRRQAGKLLYELEVWRSDRPSELADAYAEIMSEATGFRYDGRTYLEGTDRRFWVARQLRAWMLWATLWRVVRDRFDEDWFRNPAAGRFLFELFSGGQREDATLLARELGAERLAVQPVVEAVRRWLP
ncbi:MAG: hypothetical protein ACE5HP_01140 [Gemmatimonadota bacterium]